MTSTDFGFQKVPQEQKEAMVQKVFSDVASSYDVMNDLMSLGMHHAWKNDLVNELRPGNSLLDIAGGTGDIARRFVQGGERTAVICDLNQEMLEAGQKRIIDDNFLWRDQLTWRHGNAEELPFADDSFDLCTISFGIRNVTNIDKALREARRVLKVGGKFVCLEFSDVSNPIIAKVYDIYSLKWIPTLGGIVADDKDAYKYLVESIRKFPNAKVFANMMEEAGFKSVWFAKKTFGVVAIHTGYKI